MLVIRLFRIGKKNQPSFKIVVTDKRNPTRAGRFTEEVGFYNPVTKEKVLRKERVQYWIGQGAKPSATIHNLLVREGILTGKKIPKQKKSKKPAEKTEAKVTEVQPQSKPTEAPAAEKPVEKPAEAPKPEEPKKEEPKPADTKAAEPQPAKPAEAPESAK